MKPASEVPGAIAPSAKRSSWLQFPYREIAGRRTLEEIVVRFVWTAIPLEFYVLMRFAGGIKPDQSVAVVIVVLMTVAAVLGVAFVVALVPWPRETSYESRVRVWSVTVLLSWTTSLLVLAISYMWGALKGYNTDVLEHLMKTYWPKFPSFANYPSIVDPKTFTIYLCYAAVAVALLQIVLRYFGKAPAEPTEAGPSILIVIPITAAILSVSHGFTKLT